MPVEITNRLGPGRHLVSYFVGRGRRHLNLVCIVPESSWDIESWTEPGDLGDLRREFADWAPGTQRILDEIVEPVFKWALYDREPLARWSDGRITLLGDACHPMVPFMALPSWVRTASRSGLVILLSRGRQPGRAALAEAGEHSPEDSRRPTAEPEERPAPRRPAVRRRRTSCPHPPDRARSGHAAARRRNSTTSEGPSWT